MRFDLGRTLRFTVAPRVAEVLPARLCSDLAARLPLGREQAAARARAAALIRRVRPDLARNEGALREAASQVGACTRRVYAELPHLDRLIRSGRSVLEGTPVIDDALGAGRPVILLFTHTGNWELTGMHLAQRHPHRILAVFAALGDAAETGFAMRCRSRMPVSFALSSPRVWKQALAHLRRPGGMLWLAADEWDRGHVRAPFFGREPFFGGNLGKAVRLAAASGAAIIPLCSERRGRVILGRLLPSHAFDRTRGDAAASEAAVLDLEAVIAREVRRLVAQWYMAPYAEAAAAATD